MLHRLLTQGGAAIVPRVPIRRASIGRMERSGAVKKPLADVALDD
jgi:hypothetical protein